MYAVDYTSAQVNRQAKTGGDAENSIAAALIGTAYILFYQTITRSAPGEARIASPFPSPLTTRQ